MSRNITSRSLSACCILLALFALAATPLTAEEDRVVIKGAEVVGDAIEPHRFYGDVRDLPKVNPWGPGDPYVPSPRRWYGPDTSFPTDPQLDPLVTLQRAVPARGAETTVLQAFEGVDNGFLPDPSLDVGPNHVIHVVNASAFAIYDKAGNILTGPTPLDSIGTGACAAGRGDPIVLYDEASDRWLISEFSSGFGQCLYISMTNDPVSGGWCQYLHPPGTDYQKYAFWPGMIVGTANEGNNPPVYLFDYDNMINCGTARPVQKLTGPGLPGLGFEAFTPADPDGPTPPPANSPAFLMRHRDTELGNQGPALPTQDIIELWQVEVDFDNAANTTLTQLPDILMSEFDSNLCPPINVFSCIPQPGTTTRVDPLLEVIMYKVQYRNFGTHESMVAVLQTDIGDFQDHSGERWFELRRTPVGTGNWTLHQEGTYSPDADHRFMGAIGMDGDGNMLMVYALSSSTTNPSVAFTGRLAGDPLGTMTEPEQIAIAGAGNTGSIRFGDYSHLSLDPADDCTFWFTVHYTESANNSAASIGSVRFNSCVGTTPLFADGFESGDTSGWETTVPFLPIFQ